MSEAAKQIKTLAAMLHPSKPLEEALVNDPWVLALLVQLEITRKAVQAEAHIPDHYIREQLAIRGLL